MSWLTLNCREGGSAGDMSNESSKNGLRSTALSPRKVEPIFEFLNQNPHSQSLGQNPPSSDACSLESTLTLTPQKSTNGEYSIAPGMRRFDFAGETVAPTTSDTMEYQAVISNPAATMATTHGAEPGKHTHAPTSGATKLVVGEKIPITELSDTLSRSVQITTDPPPEHALREPPKAVAGGGISAMRILPDPLPPAPPPGPFPSSP